MKYNTLAIFASIVVPTLTVDAHNLDTRATSISFARDFVSTMSTRAAAMQQPVQIGDEFWVILKTTPGPGTEVGVGGYQTFYVPEGVQIVDAAYMRPAAADPRGFVPIPMKGQSPVAVGAGPIGAKAAVGLTGFSYPAPNILGVNQAPVTATGISRGTLAGVYADTGIFYSTDTRTAFNSYGAAPTGGAIAMENNSGDIVGEWDAQNVVGTEVLGVMTLWDSYQLRAFGRSDLSPLIDAADGRGNAPWGMASAVAGPQSGYAWSFNHAAYVSAGSNPAAIAPAIEVGPWQRIKYPGSQASNDTAGSASTTLGFAGVDASSFGATLSPASPLPTTTKAIRFAIGQLELGREEYSAVKVKVLSLPAAQCYKMYADAFGGDAGGQSTGKDHLWRYFDPTVVSLQSCVMLQKVVAKTPIVKDDTTTFRLTFSNLQGTSLTNVSVTDTLPSGLEYVSATPAPASVTGGNPTWTLGTVAAGAVREFTITVRGSSEGTYFNKVTAMSGTSTLAVAEDSVLVEGIALLRKQKTVTPSNVAPGANVTYAIEITNDGTAANVTPMTIRDLLPPGFTYVSLVDAKINGATITPAVNATNTAKPVVTVSQGIPAGQSLIVRFVANVGSGVVPGTYYNQVEVDYGSKTLPPVYEAPVTVAGGRIGDTVFRDWNGNGAQDAGEEGLPGISVALTYFGANGVAGGGDDVVTTRITDAGGNYMFTGLVAGNYQVSVPTAGSGGVPTGYTLTADPNGAPISSVFPVTLTADQQFLTADFGYRPAGTGSIGDMVFEDINNNGTQGSADPGIPNVTVNLHEDSNGNGVIDSGDNLIATQTTDANGAYLFAGLATGLNYIVRVDQTDADLTAYFSPNAFQISTPATKAYPNLSGANLTADFGFWPLLPSSIGDTAFKDVNGNGIYNPGTDVPLANITVSLYRDLNENGVADSGELFTTTFTDYAGQYLFGGLGPDKYLVVVNGSDLDLPGGLTPTVSIHAVELGVNENFLTADFPFVSTIDKSVDKATANPGDTLNYTITPNYPGQSLLTNVRVTDAVPAGTVFTSAGQGGTHSNGTVTWNLGSNVAGIPGVGGPPSVSTTLGDATAETSRDTHIDENSPDANKGADTELWINPETAKKKRALVQWDLSSIPAGSTVTGVSVKFWVRTTKAQTVTLHRITAPWDGGTGNNSDGADWTKADDNPDVFWASAGGDFDATSLGTFSASTSGSKTTTSAALKSLVQAWVNGTTANNGIALTTAGASGDAKLGSSENGTAAQRPQLVVTYLSPQVSPAPLTPAADTHFRENSTTNNYGTDSDLLIRDDDDGSTDDRTSVLRWDLSTIPSGAVITSAKLDFYVNSAKNYTVGVAPLTRAFVESQATWTNSQTGTLWTSPGGAAADAGTRVGTFSTATSGAYQTVAGTSGTSILSMVQGWVDTPANNLGVRLRVVSPSSESGEAKVDSRENSNPPRLTLTYELASTSTNISTSAPLVGGSGPQSITVTMDISASGNTSAKTVTPPANLTPTGTSVGAIAKSSGPTPATAVIPAGGGMASFSWVYLVTPGTVPGSVRFGGIASATGLNLQNATSPSVIVTPRLTFAATVTNPLTSSAVENIAVLRSNTVIPPTPSPVATTALTASIGDTVFADLNGNGVQDPGEPGLGGIQIKVTDGVSTYFDTTDGNGNYRVYGLGAGNWAVTLVPATVPADYVPTVAPGTVSLAALQQYNLADFGLRPPPASGVASSIGDTLWIDANEDGIKDSGETAIPNITVNLYRDSNNNGIIDSGELLVKTTETDANGTYSFGSLYAGDYLVDVVESDPDFPAGLELVSGGTVATGLHDVSLASSQNLTTADFGYNHSGKIGDFVWWDYNRNGAYDPTQGETPITAEDTGLGVLVFLFEDTNNNGTYEISDQQIATGNVDTNGFYLFENLAPGRYFVQVYDESVDHQGGDDEDFVWTTGQTQTVNLAAGQQHLTADFGIDMPTFVSGHLYIDANGNGVQDSGEPDLANVNVIVTDSNGVTQTVATDSSGNWTADVPPGNTTADVDETDPQYPTGYLQTEGNDPTTVTAVAGADISAGNDGYYRPATITGHLYTDTNGNGTQESGEPDIAGVDVLITDTNGATQTVTSNSSGNWTATVPPGLTTVDVDETDSEYPTGSTQTEGTDPSTVVAVAGTITDAGIDGFHLPATITGHLYTDTNGNGAQDSGEPSLAGVDVLITDVNSATQTVTTDASGNWTATVPPGLTSVDVDETDPDYPTGYTQTEGTDPSTVTAVAGTSTDAGNDGYYLSGGISGSVLAGSSPLEGVVLTLVDATGNPVDGDPDTSGVQEITTATAANGSYSFGNLPPGTYGVRETQPDGYYSVSDKDGGDNDHIGDKTLITVVAGEVNNGNDFIEEINTCTPTWATWKQVYPGEEADGNPEADSHENLNEFAFNMNPYSGAGDAYRIQPSTITSGTIDAVFIRPIGAVDNVVYTLQYAATVGNPTVWSSIVIDPSMYVSDPIGSCLERITITNLETRTGLSGGTGVVRIRTDLDEENDTAVDHTSYTGVEGWKRTPIGICCQTYNTPYLTDTIFTGAVSPVGINGQTVDLSGSSVATDLATLLSAPGATYFLEITDGAGEGNRYDIASASGSTVTLANDASLSAAGAPYNTVTGAPSGFEGSSIVIRRHRTLAELFPPSNFVASTDQSLADEVQIYSGGAWTIVHLYNDSGTPRWVDNFNNLIDRGGIIIAPGQGLFFNNRNSAKNLLSYGEVRENDFIRPLSAGSNLVGGGYPLDQSATGTGSRVMTREKGFHGTKDFKTADSFFVWKGDTTPNTSAYDSYYLLYGAPQSTITRWVKVGDATFLARDSAILLPGNRAAFTRSAFGIPAHGYPAPWAADPPPTP